MHQRTWTFSEAHKSEYTLRAKQSKKLNKTAAGARSINPTQFPLTCGWHCPVRLSLTNITGAHTICPRVHNLLRMCHLMYQFYSRRTSHTHAFMMVTLMMMKWCMWFPSPSFFCSSPFIFRLRRTAVLMRWWMCKSNINHIFLVRASRMVDRKHMYSSLALSHMRTTTKGNLCEDIWIN